MNIKNLLEYGIQNLKNANIEEANLKSKILLSSILNVNKEYFIIHDNEELENSVVVEFQNKIEELKKGKPIQYLTCKQEFMGLNFYVNENVLIPQPDTEVLVEEALKIIKKNNKKNILDICTGSGIIAISLKANCETLNLTASDVSLEALEISNRNAADNNVNIKFILSNMFENIEGKFDLIVSNPPYIENDVIRTLPKEVQSEPYIALAGGEDGLDFYKIIAKEGKKFLNEDGYIAVEIGYNQKEAVIKLFKNEGYKEIYSKKDYSGNDRIVVAKI